MSSSPVTSSSKAFLVSQGVASDNLTLMSLAAWPWLGRRLSSEPCGERGMGRDRDESKVTSQRTKEVLTH